MAASDPSPGVATRTGVLQGVAAFSWDSTAWQPVDRAGPAVATPTGALQGVAPFAWDGSVWQPSGRAGPGVATPTGVLDGVAVYTWSGSAWTPAGGTATPSTPSGALRGVAAFSWDGSAWQPAAQAGPSVPTPYGVLQGVAVFNWTGSAWSPGSALPAGATLDLSFLTPGSLDPRITFTRASTATYFDSTGTLQTAATNLILQSSDASNATWLKAGAVVVAPIVTGNQTTAPDGTLTASRAVYPAVVGTNALSVVYQNIALPTGVYTFTAYLKGNVGGERVWLSVAGWGSGPVATLTTQWQRFTFVTPTLPTATFGFQIGVDLRDGAQTSTSAQTIFIWGTQVEVGSLASFYTPTTTVANGAPRWDYNPSTHALNGLLIEEARTNLLLNSATLGTQSVTVTAVATTLSFYGTGTVTLSGTFAGSLVGTGAFPARASLTFTPTAGTLTCTVTGTVTNAQVEAGAFPTSYIPTTAASVTRAADNASMPTAAWFNASAGTLQAEVMIARATEAARFAGLVQIDSGSNTNRFNITTWTGLNSIRIFAAPSNPGVILGNWIANAITKGAATYAGLAVTGSLNGAAIQSGAMGSSPVGINNLKVGCSAAAGDELDGWIRRIRYWPRALSNAELQAVTS